MNLKKSISLVLTLCMVFSLFATFVFPVAAEGTTYTLIDTVEDLTAGTYYMGGVVTNDDYGPYQIFSGSVGTSSGKTDLFTSLYTYTDGVLATDSEFPAAAVVLAAVEGKENTYTIYVDGKGYITCTDYSANRRLNFADTACEWVVSNNANGGITFSSSSNGATTYMGINQGSSSSPTKSKFIRNYSNESTLSSGLVFFAEDVEEVVPVTSQVVDNWNHADWNTGVNAANGAYIYTDATVYAETNMWWWNHAAFAPTDVEGVYEVTEIAINGSTAAQESSLTVPENGFVWVGWSGAAAGSAGNYAFATIGTLEVGDKLSFVGVDIANKTTTADAYVEKYIDPNAPVNVALGKDYELSGCGNRASYYGDLTDGLSANDLNGDNHVNWFGFYCNGTDESDINAPDKVGTVIIDLGAMYDISSMRTKTIAQPSWGIAAAEAINFYTSVDGVEYTLAGSGVVSDEQGVGYWSGTECEVTAQFVKLEVKLAGTFAFIGEFEVYGAEAVVEEEAEKSVTATVTDGSVNIPAEKLALLCDGNDAASATSFSDAGLVGFENTGFAHTDGVDAAVSATIEFVLDLGEATAISGAYMTFFRDENSMVALPVGVVFEGSVDGKYWYNLNAGGTVVPSADDKTVATAKADFSSRAVYSVRYVKATVTYKNGWIFAGELGVLAAGNSGVGAIAPDYAFSYTANSTPSSNCIGIFGAGTYDLSTSEEGKYLKTGQLLIAKKVADGIYVTSMNKVNPWPDGHSGEVTIAEDEILVSIVTGGTLANNEYDYYTTAKWITRGLPNEGTVIVVDEEASTVAFYPANYDLPKAPVLLPEDATGLDVYGYTHTYINYVMYADTDMTLGELTAKYLGTAKDLNYFKVIVVNADGTVAATYLTLGRPDGVKTDFTITAGQYVLALSADGSNAGRHEIADTVNVGDIVTLYNVDLTAAPGALTNAGFTVEAAPVSEGLAGDTVSKWDAGANFDVLTDGYTGVGEVNNYDPFQSVLYGVSNSVLEASTYTLTFVMDETVMSGVVLYALDFANGGVMLPGAVTVTVNGADYEAVITPNASGIATIEVDFGTLVVADTVVVTVAMDASPYDFTIFNMYTEFETILEAGIYGNENLSQWGDGANVDILFDDYTGVGEIAGYEGNGDKLFGIGNAVLDATEYVMVFDTDGTAFDALTLYALDYANGGVMLPEAVTVVINGVEYEAVITANENGIATIVVELSEEVTANQVIINVSMAASPYGFGIYHMYTELELTVAAPNLNEVDGGALPEHNPRNNGALTILANTAITYTVEFENGANFNAWDETITVLVNGEALVMGPQGYVAVLEKGDTLTLVNATAEEYYLYPSISAIILGTYSNPIVLEELGDITAVVTDDILNNGGAAFYTYTATADGKIVFTMLTETNWTYTVNNITAGIYGDTQWSDSDPVLKTWTVEVKAGDEVQISVAPYDPENPYSAPAGEIKFNVAFEAAKTFVTGEFSEGGELNQANVFAANAHNIWNKDFSGNSWWGVTVLEWNAEENAWEVVKVLLSGADVKDGTLTETQIALAAHVDNAAAYASITALQVGDIVYIWDAGVATTDKLVDGVDANGGFYTTDPEKTGTTALTYKAVEYLAGDVNMNGKIDANDYATIRKLVVGSLTEEDLSAKALELADVNGNGKIDANDYILVKRHVLGTYTIPAWEDVE